MKRKMKPDDTNKINIIHLGYWAIITGLFFKELIEGNLARALVTLFVGWFLSGYL